MVADVIYKNGCLMDDYVELIYNFVCSSDFQVLDIAGIVSKRKISEVLTDCKQDTKKYFFSMSLSSSSISF